MDGKNLKSPSWISVKDADLHRIETLVQDFEKKSGLEIVPLIVRRSSPIGHVAILVMLILSLIWTLSLWELQERLPLGQEWIFLGIGYLVSFFFSFPLSRLAFVQRWLTPNFDEQMNVERRAWAEFYASKVARQSQGRGVLVMISLMERRVIWLADEAVRMGLPEEIWSDLAKRTALGLRQGDWVLAFEASLLHLAEAAQSLPRAANPVDELGNGLQIRE